MTTSSAGRTVGDDAGRNGKITVEVALAPALKVIDQDRDDASPAAVAGCGQAADDAQVLRSVTPDLAAMPCSCPAGGGRCTAAPGHDWSGTYSLSLSLSFSETDYSF
jgi:hypothetical protein